jgi:hypothetical protein
MIKWTEWLPIHSYHISQLFSKIPSILAPLSKTDESINKFAKTTLHQSSSTPTLTSLENKAVISLQARQKDLSQAIEEFRTDLEGWVREYDQVKGSIKESNHFLGTLLDGIDYVFHIHPLLLSLFFTVSDRIVEAKIERWHNWFKMLDLGVCLALAFYKSHMLDQQKKNIEVNRYPEKLRQIQATYQKLQEDVVAELQRRDPSELNLDSKFLELSDQIRVVENLFRQKHGQVAAKCQDRKDQLQQASLRASFKTLALAVKQVMKKDESVGKAINSAGNHAIQMSKSQGSLPHTSSWQKPVGLTPTTPTSQNSFVSPIFTASPEYNDTTIAQYLEVLKDNITICHQLKLEKDEGHLKTLLDLKRSFLDLKSKFSHLQTVLESKSEEEIHKLDEKEFDQLGEEFDQLDEEFNKLSESFHETSALLIKQVISETGSRKEAIERQFVEWRVTQSAILLLTCGIQIALWAFPQSPLAPLHPLIEHLTINRVKQLPLTSFLFPEKSIKLMTMSLLIAEHLTLGLDFKPHEYSLEGYKLSFQIRFFRFIDMILSSVVYFDRALSWIQAHMISNQINRFFSQHPQNAHASIHAHSYTTCLNRQQANCQKHLKGLQNRFNELTSRDSKNLMYPGQPQKDDPFIALNRVFQQINLDYVSEDVQTFFREKGLADPTTFLNNLERIFGKREGKFIKPPYQPARAAATA